MGMQFTVSITGRVRLEGLDASDVGIDAQTVIANEVG